MTPKSAKRFSDQVMRKMEGMTPKSAKRFWDRVMRFSRTNAFVCPEATRDARSMVLAMLMPQPEKA
jgi:hypothetical protein